MSGLLSAFGRDDPQAAFSARLLGLVAEDAVRAWCKLPDSPYDALPGRPTLKAAGQTRGHTLDFLLRRRGTDPTYVAELKVWPAFDDGRFAVLDDPAPVDAVVPYARAATEAFLQLARDPASLAVTVRGKPVHGVGGAILIWASVTADGRTATMERFGFADVLGFDHMVADLVERRPAAWIDYIDARRRACDRLFDLIAGRS